jgi:large subunit ribosomal protein L3
MTQVYTDDGLAVPVTVIQAGPCHVLQLRTLQRDGYEAVQLGFQDKPRRKASRSERGHVAPLASKRAKKLAASGVEPPEKARCEPKRFIRELRGPTAGYQVGEEVTLSRLEQVSVST